MKEKISIMSMASISALGNSKDQIWENYLNKKHTLKNRSFDTFDSLVSDISDEDWNQINKLKESSHL